MDKLKTLLACIPKSPFKGHLTEEIESLQQQLAAALAACEAKDKALQEVVDLISESSGVYGLHLNGDPSPWEELEMGGRFERLTTLLEALAIKPDASALKVHDDALIERCAEVAYHMPEQKDWGMTEFSEHVANAIRCLLNYNEISRR